MTQQRADYPLDYTKSTPDKSRTQEVADAAVDRLMETAARAEKMVGDVADQARVYGEKAQEAAAQVKPFVEKSLKEQPMATLAVASVIGFVLGALWKK
jgi:ElaB/YqjD/DUF883 family membrane-anchored ribosome-binding protein